MFFIGIVVRGYRPGVKNDYAPVFEGGQGRGKSTALQVNTNLRRLMAHCEKKVAD